MKLFESAALRLSLAYLGVIMLISVLFSVIIYRISSHELERELTSAGPNWSRMMNFDIFEDLRREQARAANRRLVSNLVLLNLGTLTIGGIAAYLLARRTLQPIQRAMDEQARFTGDASHELRTPLAAMRSEIEVALRDKRLSVSDARALLESNLEEVVALQGLSDRLLQLSSDEPLPLEPVSLGEVIEAAVERVRSAASSNHITLEADMPAVKVRADGERLTDLLVILLDNAIKYSEVDSVVAVHAEIQGKMVVVSVTDTGVGMRASDVPHIFERFYRGDSARGRSGHGLGLSIAQRIAEQHGTRIQVESQPGKGSTFSVKLPVA